MRNINTPPLFFKCQRNHLARLCAIASVAILALFILPNETHAEIVYRGMFITDGLPTTGNDSGNKLGVRAGDVVTYEENEQPWVNPLNAGAPQGVSVSYGNPCNLPDHRRPPGPPWNGTGSVNLHIWSLDTDTLVDQELQYIVDPDPDMPHHGFIAPGQAMSLAAYRGFVIGTSANWVEVAAPDPACPAQPAPPPPPDKGKGKDGGKKNGMKDTSAMDNSATKALKKQMHAFLSLAKGDARLIEDAIKKANANGLQKQDILTLLQAAAQKAEANNKHIHAEQLWTLCDRIVGFTGKHAVIKLK